MIEELFTKYSYLLLGCAFALIGPVLIYIYIKWKKPAGNRSIFEYILVWPILIDQHKKAKKGSNKFIFIGAIIMILLIVYGIWSDNGPQRR